MPDRKFIAFGQQGIRLASADGRVWSEPVLEKEKYYIRVCGYAAGRYVACATYGSKWIMFTSEDGLAWKKSAEIEARETGDRLNDICFGNDRLLIVGGNGDGHWASSATSADGLKWNGPKRFDKQALLMRVGFGDGKFVAVGYKGRVAVSTDGQSWTDAEPLGELDTFIDIAYGNGVFVGAGLHGLRMVSTDGLHWTDRVVGEEGEHINSLLFTGEQFVGVGLGATFNSADGRDWQRMPNQNAPVVSAFGNGVFVGTRWKGRILHSTDAIEWTEVLKTPEHVNGVFFPKA